MCRTAYYDQLELRLNFNNLKIAGISVIFAVLMPTRVETKLKINFQDLQIEASIGGNATRCPLSDNRLDL